MELLQEAQQLISFYGFAAIEHLRLQIAQSIAAGDDVQTMRLDSILQAVEHILIETNCAIQRNLQQGVTGWNQVTVH